MTGGDLSVLRQVLHNWEDAHVRTIPGGCHRAGRPGSRILESRRT